jgi:hypothetical protein
MLPKLVPAMDNHNSLGLRAERPKRRSTKPPCSGPIALDQ